MQTSTLLRRLSAAVLALAVVGSSIAKEPRTAAQYYRRGMARQAAGNLDGAIRDFTTAIYRNSNIRNPEPHRMRQVRSGAESEDVSDLTENILVLDRFNATAYFSRGAARAKKGYMVAAIRDFDKVLTFDPRNSWALGNRGYAKQRIGDIPGAMQDYSSAVRINGRNFIAFNNRGILRYDLKDLDGAILDYTRAIEIDPRQAAVFNNRGRAYKDKREFEKAREDLDKALSLDPRQSLAYLSRAHLNLLEGRSGEAARDLEAYRAYAGNEGDTLPQVVREALQSHK